MLLGERSSGRAERGISIGYVSFGQSLALGETVAAEGHAKFARETIAETAVWGSLFCKRVHSKSDVEPTQANAVDNGKN